MSIPSPSDTPDLDSDHGTAAPEPQEKPMGFLEHLEELRGTLLKCAITFAVSAALIGFFLADFNDVLLWPLRTVQAEHPEFTLSLNTRGVMEAFGIIIQLCGFGGLALSAPFMLYFVGQFIAPALTTRELRLVFPAAIAAFILFLLGAAFGFFLLIPSTLRVSLELNSLLNFAPIWTPESYYSILTWLVFGVGAAFEFPLLIVIAVHLGLLRVQTLRKYRRHAIVLIFVVAAIVTPTPDPFTQSLFAVPLYLLFEISVIISTRVQARRETRLAAEDPA